jgi:hypothetical protein
MQGPFVSLRVTRGEAVILIPRRREKPGSADLFSKSAALIFPRHEPQSYKPTLRYLAAMSEKALDEGRCVFFSRGPWRNGGLTTVKVG